MLVLNPKWSKPKILKIMEKIILVEKKTSAMNHSHFTILVPCSNMCFLAVIWGWGVGD